MRHLARLSRSLGLVAWLLLAAAALRAAPADEARRALETGVAELTTALRAPTEETDLLAQLDTLVDRHFAFATTTRLAVGPAWRDFTPAEREEATRLFSRLIIRTYADRLRGEAAAAPTVDYGVPVELRATRVEVPTRTSNGSRTYAIAYRMESSEKGWRIYDVVAEGVSLVGNYRAQFEPVVARGGAAALLAAIREKLAESAQ